MRVVAEAEAGSVWGIELVKYHPSMWIARAQAVVKRDYRDALQQIEARNKRQKRDPHQPAFAPTDFD